MGTKYLYNYNNLHFFINLHFLDTVLIRDPSPSYHHLLWWGICHWDWSLRIKHVRCVLSSYRPAMDGWSEHCVTSWQASGISLFYQLSLLFHSFLLTVLLLILFHLKFYFMTLYTLHKIYAICLDPTWRTCIKIMQDLNQNENDQ